MLLDVRLVDGSGLEVNRWLAEHHPAVKVIMLTMSEDHDTALTALRDGASGYLVKGAGPERVEHALRAVAAGDVVLDHALAQAVTELAQVRRTATNRPFPELTHREFAILELVAEGLDNQTIARRLVLSPKTVRNHVSNVFAKIQAADRPGGRSCSARASVRAIGTWSASASSAHQSSERWSPRAPSTSSRWAPTSGPAIGRWAATRASASSRPRPCSISRHTATVPARPTPGAAVHEQVLAAVEPAHGAVEERADARQAGAWRSGIGNHRARSPSCSWSQARTPGSGPPAPPAG